MIFITGASGNVGSEVLKQASAAGLKLRAGYQSQEKARLAPPGAETAVIDFARPETLRAAFHGVEKLFLVGPPNASLPELEAKAVKEAQNAGVPHIVKLSALGGRGSVFPGLHAQSEDQIRSSGLRYTFLRPNGFMQNFVNYSGESIRSSSAFFGSLGQGAVSHIDIRDVAAAAVVVLSTSGHEGNAYALTGPEALTQAQIAAILSRILGRNIEYVDLPSEKLKQGMLQAGVPEWSANALLDLERFYREGRASQVEPTVQQLTGRPPQTFEQFARDYAAAFRDQRQSAS